MPLFFATSAMADELAQAEVLPEVSVVITTQDEITSTQVTLTTAQETLTIVTNTLTEATTMASALTPTEEVTTALEVATQAVTQAVEDLTAASAALVEVQEKADAKEVASIATQLAEANLVTANADLATANTALDEATTAKNAQEQVVNQETTTLNSLINTPSDSFTYTTPGYIEPTTSASPSPSTTALPAMWDAYTRIDVPFDIKLGNTIYEGQGSASQIYITSKATITFGQGDFAYWAVPQTPNIAVYHSDWMTAGVGAYANVTTTENTLKVEWSLHRFGDSNGPLTNVQWNMTVNPETGEWTGYSSISGNTDGLYGGPNIGVRETQGGEIQNMTYVQPQDLAEDIAAQTVVVEAETVELQTLIEAEGTATIVVSEKEAVVVTAENEVIQAQNTEQLAVVELAEAIVTSNTLSDAAVVSVTNAETQVTTTYIVVDTERVNQIPKPVVPEGAVVISEGGSIDIVLPAGKRITSIAAWYGDPDNATRGVDVSSTLTASFAGATTATINSSNQYGDPAPGTVKVLILLPVIEDIPQPPPAPEPTTQPTVEPSPEPSPTPTPTPTETPVIIEPTPTPIPEETVEPTPEPTVDPTPTPTPTEEPTPSPTPSEEPTPEPTQDVVESLPEPEPSTTPEVQPEPELPVTEEVAVEAISNLVDIAPENLTDSQIEQLVEAANVVFETAEQGSPVYEQALEALAVAAEADDPEVPAELAAIPLLGDVAGAALEVFNNIGNVGADMAPAVREEAEKTVIASVIATGAAVNAVAAAATAASTTSSGSSGGGASGGSSGGSGSTRRKP